MSGTVPAASIVSMVLTGICVCALPFILFVDFKRKNGADVLPFFVGWGVFFLFALVIESLLHNVVLVWLPIGKTILGNIWLYAVYGGLMAGLFEETGRFVAFSTVLKKRQNKDVNALMYGAGHGGFEAIMMVGVTYLGNLVFAVLINANQTAILTAGQPAEVVRQIETVLRQLIENPAWTYPLALCERIFAIAVHIGLSVLVWFAAKKSDQRYLYPVAILLHAATDAIVVLLAQGAGWPAPAVEGAVALAAGGILLIARAVWKRNTKTDSDENEQEAAA